MDRTAETDGLLEEVDEVREPEKPGEPPAEGQPKDKEKDSGEVAELRRMLKDSERSRREFQKTAEFWAGKAQASASAPAAPKKEDEPEPKLSVDLVDALTNGDNKAVRTALREMGFVSQDEVNRTIAQTRAQITDETAILAKYPELGDDNSALFKRTGQIYNELSADPAMKNSPKLIAVAARMAKAELSAEGGKGGRSTPKGGRDANLDDFHDDDADPDEIERRERVSRQSGDRGRASSHRQDGDDGPEELNTMQKTIVARLRAAGANIDEEKYRARARAGIRMGGLPTFRRGRR